MYSCTENFRSVNFRRRYYLGDLVVAGMIILKQIKKEDVKVLNRLKRFKLGSCEYVNAFSALLQPENLEAS
jgi:hypothetical protein